jgi:prepilin-type N-terminal cleavage/methylation domain-containing protein/prepilin-type processing-associated H-X9-DG protein
MLSKPHKAFTLIEVLVVVAIIALLISILLPSLARAKAESRTVVCTGQIGQLMKASLMYTGDHRGGLPGVGRSDWRYASEYNAGTRRDWLSWLGTWTIYAKWPDIATTHKNMWSNTPENGRLWKYYKEKKLLLCPSSEKSNGKFSYTTPENVALAVKDPRPQSDPRWREGLPPSVHIVKHPADAIWFLDEDEEHSLTTFSCDDGFGGTPDIFSDRHLGKASVAFVDGHGSAYFFPRGTGRNGGPAIHYPETRSAECFQAWMIQVAPFNCKYTPAPWKWKGVNSMPKFKKDAHWPENACGSNGPGCE